MRYSAAYRAQCPIKAGVIEIKAGAVETLSTKRPSIATAMMRSAKFHRFQSATISRTPRVAQSAFRRREWAVFSEKPDRRKTLAVMVCPKKSADPLASADLINENSAALGRALSSSPRREPASIDVKES